ncbi:MAG TPA: four-helix bundle copper-binding protein [Hanamia sp.]
MQNHLYQKCIDACIECAPLCSHCAILCLEEKEVQNLVKCIRLDLECAVICRASAELLTLNSAYLTKICGLCALICDACAEECEKHVTMEHCKDCAASCRACAKEAFIIYQDSTKKETNTTNPIAYQDECAILSRCAAELISMGSAWALQISELNDIVCKASAKEFESHFNFQIQQSKDHTDIATTIHQKLLAENQQSDMDETTDKQTLSPIEAGKRKRRHVSALLAASMGRSAMDHTRSHIFRDVSGSSGLSNTGTVITYGEDR